MEFIFFSTFGSNAAEWNANCCINRNLTRVEKSFVNEIIKVQSLFESLITDLNGEFNSKIRNIRLAYT